MQGVNAFLRDKAPGMMESLVGGKNMPGFEDIYSNFEKVSQRNLATNLAGMKEAYGSRGARYSSDLARSMGQAGIEGTERLMAGAATLRGMRSQELTGLGSIALQGAQQAQGERADAMGMLVMDYLRKTGTPEALSALANFALGMGSAGQPATVIS
jgi:hypothetical protein